MLQKVQIGVLATLACLVAAENTQAQVYYRFSGQPPWSTISQGTPYYSYSYGGYPAYSYQYSYSGEVALPGFAASGYAPRMRATLEPAMRLEEATTSQSNIAPAALTNGERDMIRPAALTSYSDSLIPRATVGASVRYIQPTYAPVYAAPVYAAPGCSSCGYR